MKQNNVFFEQNKIATIPPTENFNRKQTNKQNKNKNKKSVKTNTKFNQLCN